MTNDGNESLVLNVAVYRFLPMTDLELHRGRFRKLGRELRLRGTLLLSAEGINLFCAGEEANVQEFLARLEEDLGAGPLEVKQSRSRCNPYRRWLVKIKREIIAFGRWEGDPLHPGRAPAVSPTQLRDWLRAGDSVVLLDVRNEYEIRMGTFEHALSLGIQHFRTFPEAAQTLPAEIREQRIVTFCTGGIRCEKAAPFLQTLGFRDVWQLEGGILKYFQECGREFFRGECFVFDQRVTVDAELRESTARICFACLAPLTEEDQTSPHYLVGQSCPHCYESPEERTRHRIERRHEQILQVTSPLPGQTPYTNRRAIHVSRDDDGKRLLDFLFHRYPFAGRGAWQERIDLGLVRRGETVLGRGDLVHAGQRLEHLFPLTVEPDVNVDIRILFEDDYLVVVNKPSPLPVHPCGRFNRNTLIWILNHVYAPLRIRLAHRLDANTSGVLVLSKTNQVARLLQPQFESREVRKVYLARCLGHPSWDEYRCTAPISAVPLQTGARIVEEPGLFAETHFRVWERFADDSSLLEVHPITGRTNQIRVHLWHLGYPIVGDGTYLPDHRLGTHQTLAVDAPRFGLHAWRLGFEHPMRHVPQRFEAEPPPWVRLSSWRTPSACETADPQLPRHRETS